MRPRHILVWAVCALAHTALVGQVRTLPENLQQQALEGILDGLASDADGEVLPEWLVSLEDLLSDPLDLNEAQPSDLEVFFFLSRSEVEAIILHRKKYGRFLHPLELQVVDGLERESIRKLLPFVRAGDSGKGTLRRAHLWSTGKREITFRMERTLQTSNGFKETDISEPKFEGDPFRLVGRLRYYHGSRVSYGLTFEKDAGESFFSGSNAKGFDLYSAHVSLQHPWKGCSRLLLGDFGVNTGQGLLISTGFQAGKGPSITQIRRASQRFYPQNSWQESRFFRGAAVEFDLGKGWNAWSFASLRNRDGNSNLPDSISLEEWPAVTSLQHSGLHRTIAERNDEGTLQELATGGGLGWRKGSWNLGLNGTWYKYDPGYHPTAKPYNLGFFRGNSLLGTSLHFDHSFRGNQWFGEAAWSENGGWAATTGLLSSPDRHLQVALLARHFTADHWNLWGAPLGESGTSRNESGVYAGMVIRPAFGWRISAYADVWRTPWLTFREDSPTRATEQLVRLDFEKRRQWQFYVQFRRKGPLSSSSGNPSNGISAPRTRQQLRAQVQFDLHRVLSLRTRIEWCRAGTGSAWQDGYLAAQDILYHPVGSRWSGTMRYALFHTGGYESRIYMFENDLLYSFSLRPYYHQGQRFYINLRYNPISVLTLEARYELYRLFNQESIGSGDDMIQGPVRSGFKVQARLLL